MLALSSEHQVMVQVQEVAPSKAEEEIEEMNKNNQ